MVAKKILIVEDDRMLCTLFEMFIRDLGHHIIGFSHSGKDTIAICEANPPDVILMDIHLKGDLDGIETAKIIYEKFDIPVVYISSDTEESTVKNAIYANTYGFLVKPIHKSTLGILLESAYYKHKFDKEHKFNERWKRAIIDLANNPIIVILEGKIVHINYHGLELFKIPQIEDLINQNIMQFVDDKSKDQLLKVINNSISSDHEFDSFTCKLKTSDEQYIDVAIHGSITDFNNKKALQLEIKNI